MAVPRNRRGIWNNGFLAGHSDGRLDAALHRPRPTSCRVMKMDRTSGAVATSRVMRRATTRDCGSCSARAEIRTCARV